MATDPVADVLLRAADRLERDGWTQFANFRGERPHCPHCLNGAILEELEWPLLQDNDRSELYHECLLRVQKHLRTEDAVLWNDAPERRVEHVVTALRQAAKLKPQENDREDAR